MSNEDEPFFINPTVNQRSDEAKLEETAPSVPRFKHGNNLRRRLRRRNEATEETKVDGDEEKGECPPNQQAVEESKETDPSILHRPSSLRRSKSEHLPTDENKPNRLSMPMIQHSNSSYIRRPPDEKLKEKFKSKLRGVANGVPEVHFIGEVMEGVGFNDTFVSCKWYVFNLLLVLRKSDTLFSFSVSIFSSQGILNGEELGKYICDTYHPNTESAVSFDNLKMFRSTQVVPRRRRGRPNPIRFIKRRSTGMESPN